MIDDKSKKDGSVIEFGLRSPTGVRRYWIDIERGAIPIKVRDQITNPALRPVIWQIQDDIRRVGDLGWFPHRALVYWEGDKFVREQKILEADFTRLPGPEAFVLEFEEPISVRDQVKEVDYVPSRRIDLKNPPPPKPGSNFQMASTMAPGVTLPGGACGPMPRPGASPPARLDPNRP